MINPKNCTSQKIPAIQYFHVTFESISMWCSLQEVSSHQIKPKTCCSEYICTYFIPWGASAFTWACNTTVSSVTNPFSSMSFTAMKLLYPQTFSRAQKQWYMSAVGWGGNETEVWTVNKLEHWTSFHVTMFQTRPVASRNECRGQIVKTFFAVCTGRACKVGN